MVSVDVRRRSSTHSWVALLAVAASQTAVSQPSQRSAEIRQELSERILATQSEDGPYSPELIDPLTTLSLSYEEDGLHDLSAAVTEQALQVIRANYGLRSLEQAPLIRQRITSEETRGNFSEAWDLEGELLRLARAHPEDPRSGEVFHEIGDKRIDVLERYLDGEIPPQVFLGCFYEDSSRPSDPYRPADCYSGSKDVAAQMILTSAQRNYLNAIRSLLQQRAYTSEELKGLEMDLLRTSYVYGGRYLTGRQSLSRLISYATANGEPLEKRVVMLVEVADWDLLFERRASALDNYAQIHEYMKQRGVAQSTIDAVFSPATPVMLPAFMPNPLVAEDPASSTGYIDVAFDVLVVGTTRRVEILGASNASKEEQGDLEHLILRSRFRPMVVDGEFPRASRVVVRYYTRSTGLDDAGVRDGRACGAYTRGMNPSCR